MVSSCLVHTGCDNAALGPVGATYCGGVGGGGPGAALGPGARSVSGNIFLYNNAISSLTSPLSKRIG